MMGANDECLRAAQQVCRKEEMAAAKDLGLTEDDVAACRQPLLA